MHPHERFNTVTHLAGLVLAVVGGVPLVQLAARHNDPWRLGSVTVYAVMLVVLYLSSTLYHGLHGRAKAVFHVMDHCAIYLLIAGTYTPFTLVTLRNIWGYVLFAIVWNLALLGILKDIFLRHRFRWLSVVLYIVMGWMVVIAFKPLMQALPPTGIAWIALGGLFYTSGLLFFAEAVKTPHNHGIWHLFVLGGSVAHYVAVLLYVAA